MTDWKQGYRKGSTVFKEVLDKKGNLDYWKCVVCTDTYTIDDTAVKDATLKTHEIMHLLQKLLAIQSGKTDELVFQGEES